MVGPGGAGTDRPRPRGPARAPWRISKQALAEIERVRAGTLPGRPAGRLLRRQAGGLRRHGGDPGGAGAPAGRVKAGPSARWRWSSEPRRGTYWTPWGSAVGPRLPWMPQPCASRVGRWSRARILPRGTRPLPLGDPGGRHPLPRFRTPSAGPGRCGAPSPRPLPRRGAGGRRPGRPIAGASRTGSPPPGRRTAADRAGRRPPLPPLRAAGRPGPARRSSGRAPGCELPAQRLDPRRVGRRRGNCGSSGSWGCGDPRLGRGTGPPGPRELLVERFGLAPLPAAAGELRRPRSILGGRSAELTGAQATERAFREAVARGARVVHLATHTVVDERPGRGAAILLTPAEERRRPPGAGRDRPPRRPLRPHRPRRLPHRPRPRGGRPTPSPPSPAPSSPPAPGAWSLLSGTWETPRPRSSWSSSTGSWAEASRPPKPYGEPNGACAPTRAGKRPTSGPATCWSAIPRRWLPGGGGGWCGWWQKS